MPLEITAKNSLTRGLICCYNYLVPFFGVWRSPVAHYNGVVGVGSSNLLTPIGQTRLEIPYTTASSLVLCPLSKSTCV